RLPGVQRHRQPRRLRLAGHQRAVRHRQRLQVAQRGQPGAFAAAPPPPPRRGAAPPPPPPPPPGPPARRAPAPGGPAPPRAAGPGPSRGWLPSVRRRLTCTSPSLAATRTVSGPTAVIVPGAAPVAGSTIAVPGSSAVSPTSSLATPTGFW